jgi:hypothetical protein
MTPPPVIRPVLAAALGLVASACGMVESDPQRFEALAESVAAIPVSLDRPGQIDTPPAKTAQALGLRPATGAPLKVEVYDPHQLWDVREAMERGAEAAAPQIAAAAAPVVADAVVREVSNRIAPKDSAQAAGLRPAVAPRQARRPLVQLGAFSSEEAARSAWNRLKSGEAAWALSGLTPVFEAVEVNGRRLVRLKVATPAAGAAAVCAAARIDDPWCHRAT